MIRTALLLSALLLLSCTSPHAQLGRRIDRILAATDARIGVAVIAPDGECLVRCDTMLPMLSVFKFPAAVALLDKTARERTSLTTPVRIGPEWLDRNTYSPLRDSLPTTGGTLTLTDLLRYSISQSDNIACDILLEALPPQRLCGVARNIRRAGESAQVMPLGELRDFPADMFCTVFIGNSRPRTSGELLVTPRGYRDV